MKKIVLSSLIVLGSLTKVFAVEVIGDSRALFNEGEKCGYISLVTSEDSDEFKSLNITSIPVFTFFPAELSTVSGVITLVEQPRNSHIGLKAKDWNIPNADISKAKCVLNNGSDSVDVFSSCFSGINIGDYIYLKVVRSGRVLTAEKTDPSDPRCGQQTAVNKVSITGDLSYAKISDHKDLSWKDYDKVGSKAANYAELIKALNTDEVTVVTPGFAIPFYYYANFINENSNVKAMIEDILTDSKLNDPIEAKYRGEKLEELQALIMSDQTKINEAFLKEVIAKADTFLDEEGHPAKLKFRSSTNSEDLPNFTGAGLYTSKSYKPVKKGKVLSQEDKVAELTDTIKTVWASIWNLRAYDERVLYGIDHRQVYMGIQVNRSYSNEIASGVVVTKDVLDETGKTEGIYIEAQRGDEFSVENPVPGVLPERIVVVVEQEQKNINRVGNSTIDIDAKTILPSESKDPVLLDKDVMDIYELSKKAEAHFKPIFGKDGEEFALDMEFKVDVNSKGERAVFFKQARPYLIK